MKSVFKMFDYDSFLDLAIQCEKYFQVDYKGSYEAIKEIKKERSDKNFCSSEENLINKLCDHWYKSIENGNEFADYSVYSHPSYLCDVWLCWELYSRKSVKVLMDPNSCITQSVVDYIGKVDSVLDIGCGIGYTTAGLKEVFPEAEVKGTNLKESYQYSVAESLGRQRGFSLEPDHKKVGKVDLVFASEYFEHFPEPIKHLDEVLRSNNPDYLITANGFNTRSIGHFLNYLHEGELYPGKKISKMFNNHLRRSGYKLVETKIWNNRPCVWEKI